MFFISQFSPDSQMKCCKNNVNKNFCAMYLTRDLDRLYDMFISEDRLLIIMRKVSSFHFSDKKSFFLNKKNSNQM